MPAVGERALAADLLFARLTGNVTLATSDTTLQDVTGLSVSVPANFIYVVDMVLGADVASGSTEDIKFGFTFPSGASLRVHGMGGTTAGVTGSTASDMNIQATDITSGSTTLAYGTSTAGTWVLLRGVLVMSSTAGTFQVQAAQNTSGANAARVRGNSYIMLTRVG